MFNIPFPSYKILMFYDESHLLDLKDISLTNPLNYTTFPLRSVEHYFDENASGNVSFTLDKSSLLTLHFSRL